MPLAPRDTPVELILVGGDWRPAAAIETYRAIDPSTGQPRDAIWPVSDWSPK